MSALRAGDHVVSVQKPYSWTNKLLNQLLARFGIETTMIDGTDPEHFRQAIRPNTRLFVLESPNSMTFEMQDLAAVAAIARAHGIQTLIDNSYATPLNQQPIALGIDMVAHSGSKYLGGHSDIVAGVLCCSRAKAEQIFASEYMTLGGILSPHDAWLMLRGLRTLPIRMNRVAETAPQVVRYLEAHPSVEKVIYPFSPSFPQYDLALRQLKQPTGLFSVLLKADRLEDIDRFCDKLKYFILACSWGGYESLVYPAAVLYTSAHYADNTLPWNLVRLYTGLEDPETLIADLDQALAHLGKA
jgi:cystathionine beta-lyase/cystathionine gamma-synthase